MLNGRRILLGLIIASAAVVQGCAIGAGVTGASAAYVITGEQSTNGLAELRNREGQPEAEHAVKEWLDRGQLPLPVLDDGVHDFRIRPAKYVKVPRSRGAQIIELWDGESVIVEYVVSWDRQPAEYRLVKAVNRLYAGKIDVSDVPVLKLYDID